MFAKATELLSAIVFSSITHFLILSTIEWFVYNSEKYPFKCGKSSVFTKLEKYSINSSDISKMFTTDNKALAEIVLELSSSFR